MDRLFFAKIFLLLILGLFILIIQNCRKFLLKIKEGEFRVWSGWEKSIKKKKKRKKAFLKFIPKISLCLQKPELCSSLWLLLLKLGKFRKIINWLVKLVMILSVIICSFRDWREILLNQICKFPLKNSFLSTFGQILKKFQKFRKILKFSVNPLFQLLLSYL